MHQVPTLDEEGDLNAQLSLGMVPSCFTFKKTFCTLKNLDAERKTYLKRHLRQKNGPWRALGSNGRNIAPRNFGPTLLETRL